MKIFAGNEFGHPDYVEFPSSSNSYSYYYARRRYELCDDEDLRFKYLMRFDRAMNNLEEKFGWLMAPPVSKIFGVFSDCDLRSYNLPGKHKRNLTLLSVKNTKSKVCKNIDNVNR